MQFLTSIIAIPYFIAQLILGLAGFWLLFDFTEHILHIDNFFKYIVVALLGGFVSLIPLSEFWIFFYPLLYKVINGSDLSDHLILNYAWWFWFAVAMLHISLIFIAFLLDRKDS